MLRPSIMRAHPDGPSQKKPIFCWPFPKCNNVLGNEKKNITYILQCKKVFYIPCTMKKRILHSVVHPHSTTTFSISLAGGDTTPPSASSKTRKPPQPVAAESDLVVYYLFARGGTHTRLSERYRGTGHTRAKDILRGALNRLLHIVDRCGKSILFLHLLG